VHREEDVHIEWILWVDSILGAHTESAHQLVLPRGRDGLWRSDPPQWRHGCGQRSSCLQSVLIRINPTGSGSFTFVRPLPVPVGQWHPFIATCHGVYIERHLPSTTHTRIVAAVGSARGWLPSHLGAQACIAGSVPWLCGRLLMSRLWMGEAGQQLQRTMMGRR
jgi:hypothetical protein